MKTTPTPPVTRRTKTGITSAVTALLAFALCTAVTVAQTVTTTTDIPVTLRIETDRAVLPANAKEKAIIKISLDGLRRERAENRPPVNLAVVLDRSGSMNGEKIRQAKAAAIEALNRLAKDDIFSLVTFDSKIETVIPATRIGNGEALERLIRNIQVGGTTALYGGVTQGASEIRKNIEDSRYIHRIILLSDGQANQGPRTPEELGRLGTALVNEGVSVTTVGLGLGYDEDLMTRLALRSDGNTYFVESAADLPRIFSAELGDVLDVVARRVVMKIDFPKDIRPLRFIGREGRINGQYAEFSLNQIYGGQEKYALIEVEIQPREDGDEYKIINAKVVFENPVSQQTASLSADKSVRFSADKSAVIASANHQVQTDYAKNLVAITQEEVVALVDAGKKSEAAQLMKTNSDSLNTLGVSYNNTSVVALSGSLSQNAEAIGKRGFAPDGSGTGIGVSRKGMVSYYAATKSQQVNSAVVTGAKTYTVKSGDTGTAIAQAHGLSFTELSALNPGINWTKLKVGQMLNVGEDSASQKRSTGITSSSR